MKWNGSSDVARKAVDVQQADMEEAVPRPRWSFSVHGGGHLESPERDEWWERNGTKRKGISASNEGLGSDAGGEGDDGGGEEEEAAGRREEEDNDRTTAPPCTVFRGQKIS